MAVQTASHLSVCMWLIGLVLLLNEIGVMMLKSGSTWRWCQVWMPTGCRLDADWMLIIRCSKLLSWDFRLTVCFRFESFEERVRTAESRTNSRTNGLSFHQHGRHFESDSSWMAHTLISRSLLATSLRLRSTKNSGEEVKKMTIVWDFFNKDAYHSLSLQWNLIDSIYWNKFQSVLKASCKSDGSPSVTSCNLQPSFGLL